MKLFRLLTRSAFVAPLMIVGFLSTAVAPPAQAQSWSITGCVQAIFPAEGGLTVDVERTGVTLSSFCPDTGLLGRACSVLVVGDCATFEGRFPAADADSQELSLTGIFIWLSQAPLPPPPCDGDECTGPPDGDPADGGPVVEQPAPLGPAVDDGRDRGAPLCSIGYCTEEIPCSENGAPCDFNAEGQCLAGLTCVQVDPSAVGCTNIPSDSDAAATFGICATS